MESRDSLTPLMIKANLNEKKCLESDGNDSPTKVQPSNGIHGYKDTMISMVDVDKGAEADVESLTVKGRFTSHTYYTCKEIILERSCFLRAINNMPHLCMYVYVRSIHSFL